MHRYLYLLVLLVLVATTMSSSVRGQTAIDVTENAAFVFELDAEIAIESEVLKLGLLTGFAVAIGLITHSPCVLFLSKEVCLVFALIRLRRGPPSFSLA